MALTVLTKEDLLSDLDEHAERLIKRTKDQRGPVQFGSTENQIAGAIHYISDKLVKEFGMDRSELSDQHGFGRIVRETEGNS